jgi:hypothetical protein
LGLSEGIWLVGYQHSRAGRVERLDPGSEFRWTPLTTAGLFLAGDVSPSVARVRLVDLLGIAGGLATAGMPKQPPIAAKSPVPRLALEPSVRAVSGGATLGISGSL